MSCSSYIFTEADELRAAMSAFNIAGRRIVSVDTTGVDPLMDKLSIYNIFLQTFEGRVFRRHPRWKSFGEPIYESDIPDDMIQTRLLSSDKPFLITLDNGCILCLGNTDWGTFTAMMLPPTSIPKNLPINANLVFKDIIGQSIAGLEVKDASKNHYDIQQMGFIPERPIQNIRLICERHSLMFSGGGYCWLLSADGKRTFGMTFAERKAAEPYILDYFDKETQDSKQAKSDSTQE